LIASLIYVDDLPHQVGGEPQYLVHWRGYPSSDDTWEPWTSLVACTDGVSAFHESMFADGTAPVGYAVGAPSPSRADADPSMPRWRILVKRTSSGREYRVYYGPLGEHVRSRATALQLRGLYEIPAHVVVPEVPWDTAAHSRASGRAVAASAAAIAAGNAAAVALLRQQEGVAVSGASTGASTGASAGASTPNVAGHVAGLPQGPRTPDLGLIGGLSGGSLAGCLNIGPMEGSAGSASSLHHCSLLLSPTINLLGQPLPQLTSAQLAQAAWGCQAASAASASAASASAASASAVAAAATAATAATAAASAPPSAAASMPPSASAASMASLGSQDGGPAGSCDSWTSDAEAAALADALFS
jgi:hypothetical protein